MPMRKPHLRSFVCLLAGVAAAVARDESDLVTAVHSRALNGYQRPRTEGGAYKPEFYALSNGGAIDGTMQDHAAAKIAFSELAQPLRELLAQQNYHFAPDNQSADLLLVVHWGTTLPTKRLPSAQLQERATEENARLLGYAQDMTAGDDLRRFVSGASRYNDLRSEIEEARHYVVISAYDFRAAVRAGERRPLWITRVSIRSPGNSFAGEFAPTLARAAPYFGQDSSGLLRRREVDAQVEIGELEVVDTIPSLDPASDEPPPQPASSTQ